MTLIRIPLLIYILDLMGVAVFAISGTDDRSSTQFTERTNSRRHRVGGGIAAACHRLRLAIADVRVIRVGCPGACEPGYFAVQS